MTQEQVESQLSAMFDGELPAAECELLSRRIDRDERLRARWARYALIGAAMRSEPVATAGRGFARAVSAAIDADENVDARGSASADANSAVMGTAVMRTGRTLRSSALAASIVAAVAGISITMLRNAAPVPHVAVAISGATAPLMAVAGSAPGALAGSVAGIGPVPVAARSVALVSNGEPRSYVTPVNVGNAGGVGLQTELADFIVAHSEYSTPLLRRNLLSALVSNEDAAEGSVNHVNAARAGRTDAIPAASVAGR